MNPKAPARNTKSSASADLKCATKVASSRSLGRDAAIVALPCALTVACLWLIFPPRGVWPLAFVCLAPWAFAAWHAERAWLFNWLSFLAGWVFFLITLTWLMPVTRLGYVALAFYLALYWPAAGWVIRTGRRRGIRVVWTLPIMWVACEYLRGWVMSGFPWLFLSHAFYEQITLIQISDVTGAYGVSFVAALINGVVVELLLFRFPAPREKARARPVLVALATGAAVLGGTLLYGFIRLNHAEFEQGPRLAIVQEDFLQTSTPPSSEPREVMFARYIVLGAAAARERPDLLVFPETAWGSTQNAEFLEGLSPGSAALATDTYQYGKRCDEAISGFARGDYGPANRVLEFYEKRFRRFAPQLSELKLPRLPSLGGPPVTVLMGTLAVEFYPDATYPKMGKFNSAIIYDKDGRQRSQRYDKRHLVPFGEYVPFRGGRLHWLYQWLNSLSPFSGRDGKYEYSLTPGAELTVFELELADEVVRFGTPICYEDVMPYVIRDYVWDGDRRRVDFLVNISNDGWFLHGDELPQHLAICVFRAVENRIGIARAVNTGISGFVDPDGRLYSLVREEGRLYGKGLVGYRIDRVRLDSRTSLYGRFGDWFARLCLLLTTLLWGEAVFSRWVGGVRRRIAARRARRNP